jgi:hypothetical protein
MRAALLLTLATWGSLLAQVPALDAPMRVDLKRLEETWRLLDQHAQAVWPGWGAYRAVPFRLLYPNGAGLLLGHPSPEPPFRVIAGLQVGGNSVAVDRSRAQAEPLVGHHSGGGGPLPFGGTKPLVGVELYMKKVLPPTVPNAFDPRGLEDSSDAQILCNAHELFHVFQLGVWSPRAGNLAINPDVHFATHAELEGIALERAYLETDPGKCRAHVLDFLAARRLKRQSLRPTEVAQEREEEVREGTATYVEMRLLERLKEGYRPGIEKSDDPGFEGFRTAKDLLDLKLAFFRKERGESTSSRNRCYFYGALQALLLSRFSPGWQQDFFQKDTVLENRLQAGLHISEAELGQAEKGLPERYPLAEIQARHRRVLDARDAAYLQFQAQKGRAFILSVKDSGDRLHAEAVKTQFAMGMAQVFREGIQPIALREGRIEGRGKPVLVRANRFLKWVDTGTPRERPFELTAARMEGDVHIDATFSCGGFVVKAARLRVRETPARIKVEVL